MWHEIFRRCVQFLAPESGVVEFANCSWSCSAKPPSSSLLRSVYKYTLWPTILIWDVFFILIWETQKEAAEDSESKASDDEDAYAISAAPLADPRSYLLQKTEAIAQSEVSNPNALTD